MVGTINPYFLWINDIFIFHPEIPFQTKHYNGNPLAVSMLEIACDIISPLICGLVLYSHYVLSSPGEDVTDPLKPI